MYLNMKGPYSHGNHEVRCALLEAAPPRYEPGTSIGDQCLDNEYEGDEGEAWEIFASELRGEFVEDWCTVSQWYLEA